MRYLELTAFQLIPRDRQQKKAVFKGAGTPSPCMVARDN